MLLSVFALVAAVSPLTIDVTTKEGHHIAVPVTDADATALRVCAARDFGEDVCAPVVSDRHGSHAALDVDHTADVRLRIASTRYDARSNAPGAVAIGAGVGTVIFGVGAIVATAIASTADDIDGVATAVDTTNAQVRELAGTAAVGMWVATAIGVIGTVVATVIAVGDAAIVHE